MNQKRKSKVDEVKVNERGSFMRNLDDYALQCMFELDSIGIPYGNVKSFEINTRAHSRWGQCRVIPGGFSININSDLLDERNDESGLKNTIIHELLHTCDGCLNHGAKWVAYANKVHKLLGYNIKRQSTADEKGVYFQSGKGTGNRGYKYLLVCPFCGANCGKYKNLCDTVKTAKRGGYLCGRCKATLIVEDL